MADFYRVQHGAASNSLDNYTAEEVFNGDAAADQMAKAIAERNAWSSFLSRGPVRVQGGQVIRETQGSSNTAPEMGAPRTASGAPIGSRELVDSDKVTISGVEMQVKEARRLGFIEKGATGTRPFGSLTDPFRKG